MNRKIYIAVISIVVFLVLVFSATFAYFYADVQTDNPMIVSTYTPTMYSILYDVQDEINLDINVIDMLQRNKNMTDPIVNDNLSMSFTLKSGSNNDKVSCTYDIVYIWDSENIYIEADKVLEDGEYEFSILGTNLLEKDLSSFSWSEDEENGKYYATVYENESIETTSIDGIVKEYELEARFYNIDAPQDILGGKQYRGHFEFANVDCSVINNYQNR